MGTKVESTKTIKIDEREYVVEQQSDTVKRLVSLLDDWRQDERDQSDALIKTTAALRDLQRELLQVIQNEEAAKAEQAAAESAGKSDDTAEPKAE